MNTMTADSEYDGSGQWTRWQWIVSTMAVDSELDGKPEMTKHDVTKTQLFQKRRDEFFWNFDVRCKIDTGQGIKSFELISTVSSDLSRKLRRGAEYAPPSPPGRVRGDLTFKAFWQVYYPAPAIKNDGVT